METPQTVDWAGKGLTALPASLERLTALEELDLDRNALAALPDWIGGLTNLSSLSPSP